MEQSSLFQVQGVAYGNVWVSSVRDVLFGRKGNVLRIYLSVSGVDAHGSLLVQVTQSGPASELGVQGRTGGFHLWNGQGIGEPGVFPRGSLQHV